MRLLKIILVLLLLSPVVMAMPGDGVQVGNLVINPFVEANYTTDSNVELDPDNEMDDAFLEGIGGIQFHYERDWFVLEGRGFVQLRRYDEFTAKDFDDWGERMVFRSGSRESLSITIDQSLRLVSDYDRSTYFGGTLRPEAQNLSLTYDRSTRVTRELQDIGMILGKTLSDTMELDLGVGSGWQDYETNVLFDVNSMTFKSELGWKMTDKMTAVVSVEITEEENESYDGAARSVALHAGLERKTTDKLRFRLGAGVNEFTRPEAVNDYGREVQARTGWERGVNEKPRNDESKFSFALSGVWIATEKISIEVAGHSAIQSTPQYPNTVDYISVGSLSTVYDFTDTITVSITGSYRRDDYLDPVVERGEEVVRLDERTAGLARIDYVPPRQFLTLFVEGGYELSESTIYHYNYDQLRLGVGLSVRY